MRAAAVLVLLLPGAMGQTPLFDDDTGDVRGTTSDGRVRLVHATGDQWPNLDILAGGVQGEDDETVSFYLNVTDLEPQQDPPMPRAEPHYFFFFRYGDQGYRLVARTDLEGPASSVVGTPEAAAWIDIAYDDDVYHFLADVEAHLDFQAEQVVWDVPRHLVRDHNHAPLGRGETLWDFRSESRAMGWFGVPILVGQGLVFEVGPPAFSDEAPEGRLRGEPYETVAGRLLHSGRLLAAAHDPVRWTNGEATTFVYYVQLHNQDSKPMDVLLGHEGADPKWQVAFSDSLRVPANGMINVTFHVAIPFGHNHGRLHDFDVTFESEDGKHWARQPLAVYWPSIPQPAGHHPEIWLHSRYEAREPPFESLGARIHGWWSAAPPEDEPFDEQLPIPAHRISALEGARNRAEWAMRLEPSLRMGLDFILEEPLAGQVDMEFPLPVQDPEFEIQLVHVDRRFILERETVLASTSLKQSGSFDGPQSFAFEADMLPAADLVRYLPRTELDVRINLTGVFAGEGFENPEEITPVILAQGTRIVLPLLEYHDPLETVFWTDASATITVGPEGQEKKAKAGDQVLFTFVLHYQGTFESSFQVELAGVNAEWARVLGDEVFRMSPGEDREVAVAVQPPLGTSVGERAEISIKAIGTVNAAVQAGMVVRTEVTSAGGVPDETEQIDAKDDALSTKADSRSRAWIWWILVLPVAGVAAWQGRVRLQG